MAYWIVVSIFMVIGLAGAYLFGLGLRDWWQNEEDTKRETPVARRNVIEEKEELTEEHSEWMSRYVEARNKLVALLPPVANIPKGEELPAWTPTEELLTELASVEREVNTALVKMREIEEKSNENRLSERTGQEKIHVKT
ncbi:MAG: hypothetical protein JSV54_00110 [Chloroflexota bacterium]|nr:MAG: hypothetical protein JSV54_00110 [Chloroflexota bacterium]